MAIGIISINAHSAQRQREYDGHVEAAERYLTELNYEQAIAEYTLALEIEPNAEGHVRWIINVLETNFEEGEFPIELSCLYRYIGEYELSDELARSYLASSDFTQTEDGFYVRVREYDGIKEETIFNQYAQCVNRKFIFIEDGSVCEYIFEWDERGREIRQTHSGQYNSMAGAKALECGVYWSGGNEGYFMERRDVWEAVEYDSLGRVKCYMEYIFDKHSDDGTESERTFTSIYTYNEKGVRAAKSA